MTAGPCNDCGAAVGQPHADGCDVARCLWTGEQRIQCGAGLIAQVVRVLREEDHGELATDLAEHEGLADEAHDCGQDVWTGEWPGTVESREFGFWCYWVPRRGWERCDAAHPEAQADLNRLTLEARWDRDLQRMVKR